MRMKSGREMKDKVEERREKNGGRKVSERELVTTSFLSSFILTFSFFLFLSHSLATSLVQCVCPLCVCEE